MEYHYLLCFVVATLVCSAAGKTDTAGAKISVDGTRVAGEVDKNFICATVDLWPHDKCNYNHCPWGFSSAMNLDLSNPLLIKAVKGLKALRIRMGGSLQDQLVYGVGAEKDTCRSFRKTEDGLFGFSAGCLNTSRWDQLNHFFQYTGAVVTFGLNALHGKHKSEKTTATATTVWEGEWDPSNARDFINYTYSKGYPVDSWELGNELCGRGVEARLRARQYAGDLFALRSVIDSVYSGAAEKPLLVAPGGFYEEKWFAELLQFLRLTGSGVVDVLSHHLYDLGPGDDPSLVGKIVSPDYLNKTAATFADLDQTIRRYGPWAFAWVGESGGAYNSGGLNVSDAFVDSFWYLDQLGMSAKYNSKVYCRQSLIGGNYGLIDKNTFLPNPDYYSALLWSQLMGEKVLAVENTGSRFLRTYAHCSKERRGGVTLLLINLSKESEFVISTNGGQSSREEYGLSPENGNLKSRTMLLNGNPLSVSSENEIPLLKPASVNDKSPIKIAPRSIKFVVLPNFGASACA